METVERHVGQIYIVILSQSEAIALKDANTIKMRGGNKNSILSVIWSNRMFPVQYNEQAPFIEHDFNLARAINACPVAAIANLVLLSFNFLA